MKTVTKHQFTRQTAKVLAGVFACEQSWSPSGGATLAHPDLSLEDYESLKESVFVAADTADLSRLMASIWELELGLPEADGNAI